MPVTIQTTGLTPVSGNASTGANKGINLLTAPEFLDQNSAQVMQGYFQKSQGKLETIKGVEQIVTTLTGESPTMLEYWTDDIFVVGYADKVATYQLLSDTFTVQDTLTTSDSFFGLSYGDFFFYTNQSDRIKYLTFGFGAEILNTTDWVQTGGDNWIISSGIKLEHPTTTDQYIASFDFSPELGVKYQLIYENELNDPNALSYLIQGPFTSIDLEAEGQIGEQTIIFFPDGSREDLIVNHVTSGTAADARVNHLSLKKQDRTTFTVGTLSNSPFCKYFEIIDSRLIATGIKGDDGRVNWAKQDTGEAIPFETWSASNTPPLPTDPDSKNFAQVGAANAISENTVSGNRGQVVVHFEKGQVGFTIDIQDSDGTGFAQNVTTQFERKGVGGTKSFKSSIGLIYTNSAGAWIMTDTAGNATNFLEPLGDEFIDTLNFDDADIIEDEVNDRIIITCKEDSTFNNLVIFYDYRNGSLQLKKGWNLSRIAFDNGIFYGADSLTGDIYEMFTGNEDNDQSQLREFEYEIPLGADGLFTLEQTVIKGFFSLDSIVEFNYDYYDKHGVKFTDALRGGWQQVTVTNIAGNAKGIGEVEVGGAIAGEDISNSLIETRFGKRTNIREFTRLILKIRSEDFVPHEITWIESRTRSKGANTTNG